MAFLSQFRLPTFIASLGAIAFCLTSGCRLANSLPTAAEDATALSIMRELPIQVSEKDEKKVVASPIEVSVTSDKARYKSGEIVRFTISACNTSDAAQSVSFASGRNFDLLATRVLDTKIIWRWSKGKVFSRNFRTVSFAPGETKTYEATWDQKLADDLPAGRGRVQITSELATQPPFSSAPLEVELVD